MATIKNDTGWAVVTSNNKKVKEKSEQQKVEGFGAKTGNKKAKTEESTAKPLRNSRRRGGSGRKNKASLAGPNKAAINAKNDADVVSRSLRKKMQNLNIKRLPPTPPGNQQQQPRNSRAPLVKKPPISPELPSRSCSSKPSNRCSSVFQSSTTTSEFSWSSSVYNYESFAGCPQLAAVQLPHFVGSEAVASHFDNRVRDISPIITMSNGYSNMYSIPEQLGGKFGAIGEERKRKLSLKSSGAQFDNNCCAAMDSKSVGSYDSGFSSYHHQPFQL